ncbi:MAG: hypothetical protein H0W78_07615 [Planctomycetes bacterium]|nr:hypothetical protein [Planctomycetota bacterium]
MRLFILIFFAATIEGVEIAQLPKEVTIDFKEILAGKEYEAFNIGYVTVRMQKYGYLDAKVVVQDGRMTAIPGNRFTIRSLTIPGVNPERQACEIPITPDNMQLLQVLFSDFNSGRSITTEDHGIHYTFTTK